jgi:hypothetical protein
MQPKYGPIYGVCTSCHEINLIIPINTTDDDISDQWKALSSCCEFPATNDLRRIITLKDLEDAYYENRR